MSSMFRNSNVELEKELAAEDYKAHPVRNRIAILAVALTAILIVVTFTVGIGFASASTRAMGASPGPGADSAMIYGDEQVLERVRALPQVEWAAYAKRCSTSYLHNSDFSGLNVRLFAADEVHYDKNMVELINGRYPVGADEILISDTMSKRLGLGEETGASYDLVVLVEGETEGEQVEQIIPMTVCGYYRNPLRNVSDFYEEIYTGEAFIAAHNPKLIEGYDNIYVKLNNLNPFKLGSDKEDRLNEVDEQAGGNGIGYKASDMTVFILIPIVLIILCIMLCGYFFIYNVFDISIVNDIRFYGELKTIGMSCKQLRRMLSWQMNRIAAIGIAIGGIVGYGIGLAASGAVLGAFAEGVSSYYKPAGFVQVFVLGGVFSWLTVYISTMRPFRIACTISPVEAARYRGKKKKGVFSVISFALSGIVFLVVYTISIGYSVEVQALKYNGTDFRISQESVSYGSNEPYQPISNELVQKLKDLEFTEDFRIFYWARTKPDYYIDRGEYQYRSSEGEISVDGELAQDLMAYREKLEREDTMWFANPGTSERGNCPICVLGMNPEYLDHESQYFNVLEGSLDAERFAEGDYVIYNRSFYTNDVKQSEGMEYQIHAGDEVTVTFYDDMADRYVERKFTVMALVTCDNIFGTDTAGEANLWITDRTFENIYSDYRNLIGDICFNVSGRMEDGTVLSEREQYEVIADIVKQDGNMQLAVDSIYLSRLHFMERKRTMTAFGILLAVIVGLIGVANMVNTVTTDVMARKVEYAAMQSIGMTGRQMKRDIFAKYAGLIAVSLALAIAAGAVLSYMIGAGAIFNFSIGAFAQAFGIFLFVSVGLCMTMAGLLTKVMNKKSVVERLREIV
ncbi:MAG: hypothetical protein K2J99_17210 [Lachnospiraceae bacterium]|nr:hypothetical protein [Lachnospiraceae bacterium]